MTEAQLGGVPTAMTGFVGEPNRVKAAVSQFTANGGRQSVIAPRELAQLDSVDVLNLLCLPGETDVDVLRAALDYAERRRAFLIVDPPSADIDEAIELARALAASGSANGAMYFPPLGDAPPSGAVAGVFARNDERRGVWKSPAGLEAVVHGTDKPAVDLDDDATVELAAAGVNAIREHAEAGTAVWGARTIQGGDAGTSEWRYVSVRRLGLYLEESLHRGTQWAVFEPNEPPLWEKVRRQVLAFLSDLWRRGALAGETPEEAYFVRCGPDTMTQDDLDDGRLIFTVGIAPLKPAEFVVLRIGQWREAQEPYACRS
jgi:uncharacterized protein